MKWREPTGGRMNRRPLWSAATRRRFGTLECGDTSPLCHLVIVSESVAGAVTRVEQKSSDDRAKTVEQEFASIAPTNAR